MTTLKRENYQADPIETSCPAGKRVMVALTLGQSNAANNAEISSTANPRVVNFYRGRCYVARDPLLGATGDRGSVWIPFANEVIAAGQADAVILVPAAVGSTTLESWAPGGVHNDRIWSRLASLSRAGLKPTHIMIQQGESEGAQRKDPALYQRSMRDLIEDLRPIGAPIYLATATRCFGDANPAIAAVQRGAGVHHGPDADAIPNAMRANLCHFSAQGALALGHGWAKAVYPAT